MELDLNIPTTGLRTYIHSLAKVHGVAYVKTNGDAWAETVTKLSGDEVETDDVDFLLVALKRAGVINSTDMVLLLVNYLREKDV